MSPGAIGMTIRRASRVCSACRAAAAAGPIPSIIAPSWARRIVTTTGVPPALALASTRGGTHASGSGTATFGVARILLPQGRGIATSSTKLSGHSRWSKIRHRKGAADAQKSQAYARMADQIYQALKPPNSHDPNSNSRLASALQRAKEGGVPKALVENIFARAKAAADGSGQSITYEAMGLGGQVALIIECLTDNPTRTVRRLKEVLHKQGCRFSPCSYLFRQKGILTLSSIDPSSSISPFAPSSSSSSAITTAASSSDTLTTSVTQLPTSEELFDIALEYGAEDVRPVSQDEMDQSSSSPSSGQNQNQDQDQNQNQSWEIITSLPDLMKITEAFSNPPHNSRWQVESSERTFLPVDPLLVIPSSSSSEDREEQEIELNGPGISEATAEVVERVVGILENESEVVRVWTNIGD